MCSVSCLVGRSICRFREYSVDPVKEQATGTGGVLYHEGLMTCVTPVTRRQMNISWPRCSPPRELGAAFNWWVYLQDVGRSEASLIHASVPSHYVHSCAPPTLGT